MSMNLYFEVKGGGIVDFPFQTPTNLTYSVLAEPDATKRVEMVKQQLVSWNWSEEDIKRTMDEVVLYMSNPNLELSFI